VESRREECDHRINLEDGTFRRVGEANVGILLILLLVISGNTWLLLRVWKKQRVRYYSFCYSREEAPFNFWLGVCIIALSLLWWSAMAILVTISLINGPLYDQRNCPSAKGWEKALNCPSVDENGEYVPRGGQ
jgi:hypothetical protein